MEDPAVVCAVEGQGKAGGGMMDPTTAMPDPNSRSSSPGQHSPFDAAKHFPVIQEPAPQGYFVHQPAYMMAPAHMAPQNIVYDAAGVPYVPYIPPVQQMPVPQMLRCYPVVQVNPQVNQQVNQQIHPQIHQQTYRSAGEPRQVHRPQGYCSAGEPGRAATLRMVAPTRGGSARVLTELSPAEVRTAFRSPPPHMQQQPQHVAGVATMVGAVPHAVRNGTRYQPASGPQYIQLPAGQLRPMAYASDPNLGARVLLSGSRRGHSAGSRVVLHDSFATVSDAPDGRNSPTVVLSSAASGSFSQPGDNRPTIAAANPYVCTPARRTVPNPFAAHCAGAPMGPARLGSGFSLTSSQSHVMEPAASDAVSEPSSSPHAAVPPMVSLLRAAASQPPRGDSDEIMAMHRLHHHKEVYGKGISPADGLREAAAAAVPCSGTTSTESNSRVWASDSASSDDGRPQKEQQLNAAVKPPAPTYVLGKNNVPKPAPASQRTAKSGGGFMCCGASAVRD